jgi:Tfp pilus assembly protein PilW
MNVKQKVGTKEQGGCTLVELLVSMMLTLFFMGAVYSVFRVQARTVKSQESRLEAQEYARAVLDVMVREIRNAGYTVSGTACAGVVTATAQTLQIRLDTDDDGDCGGPNEDITYTYNGANQDITRAVDGGGAQNLTDGNATALQFTYYAQDSTTAMSPIVAADIQRVEISLTIQSQSPDTEFGGGVLDVEMDSNVELCNRGL